MGIPLENLLKLVPSATRDQVKRASDRLNQPIREALRRATGLRLKQRIRGEEPPSGAGKLEVAVRIDLVAGLPAVLRPKELTEDEWLSALLSLHRDALEDLRSSAGTLSDLVPEILAQPGGPELVAGRQRHLALSGDLAEVLLREADRFDLPRWMLQVDQDVLGAYIFHRRAWSQCVFRRS